MRAVFTLLAILLALLAASAAHAQTEQVQPEGLVTLGTYVFEEEPSDILGEALERLGLSRDDLGYRPRGSWRRYPLPSRTPYLHHAFDDLFARPQVIPRYLHGMADPVRKHLDPARLAEHDDGLYQLCYHLAVENFAGGFRNYSANNFPELDPEAPLASALASLGRARGVAGPAFGARYEEETAAPGDVELAASLAALDPALRKVLGELVLNLAEAARWSRLSLRRADRELTESVLRIDDLGETQSTGDVYYPEIDDLARLWDRQSLAYAALKTAQALDTARLALLGLSPSARGGKGILLDAQTALGRVVLSGRDGGDYHAERCLLWVDLGGNDKYRGAAAGSRGPELPVSVLLDLNGDDEYIGSDGAQGCGLLGVGMLLDVAGNDRYEAGKLAQGCGQFGIGMLADLEGRDRWRLESSGQGAGYFGCGLLLDADGDDELYLLGEGQGYGGVGGVGVLASWGGNDHYKAEPYAEKAGRADYHSEHLVAANAAQGCGMGRRGDGSDGHSWAGGLGALIDIHGNDRYRSGNWSLGCGYWYGVGLVYEGDGDDLYESVYFTQASGAHYCIGAIVDEGGDDTHRLFENAGAGIAFGWDFTNALLIDTAGDDIYEAKIISLGLAEIRSNALLIDLGGDDLYRLDAGQLGFGASDSRKEYSRPPSTAPYYGESLSLGLLLDGGGKDRHELRDPETGRFSPDTLLADSVWRTLPAPGSEEGGYGNLGAFWDTELKRLPEIEPYLER